jgi:kynurenine formamidase
LIGPAAVVDVSERATPDYLLTVDDLTAWEDRHGLLPDGGILLVRTGWGTRWTDRAAYLGTDIVGPDAVPELHFPGIGEEAASWLVANRGIVAVGIDTPSIDYGQSADFRTHVILYAENITGFENVANLEALPEVGSYVVALPMKIEGGSGGPLRVVAFVPRGQPLLP